jgi:hypothetical protein
MVLSPSPDRLVPEARNSRPSGASAKPRGKGTTPLGRIALPDPSRPGREGHDCSRRSRSDIVATVRSEIAAAGIEVGDRTSFGGDALMWIEREDAIVAIVHIDSVPVRMDAKPARVGDSPIGAERAEHFAIRVKASIEP